MKEILKKWQTSIKLPMKTGMILTYHQCRNPWQKLILDWHDYLRFWRFCYNQLVKNSSHAIRDVDPDAVILLRAGRYDTTAELNFISLRDFVPGAGLNCECVETTVETNPYFYGGANIPVFL